MKLKELYPLLEEYTQKIILNELGELKAPIDIEKIIEEYGIEVIRGEFEQNESGAIKIVEWGARIVVNSTEPVVRQRFTLAHELGHYISYRVQKKTGTIVEYRDGTSSLGSSEEEVFANRFAASILMPIPIISHMIGKTDDLSEIARNLNVSKEALTHRIKNEMGKR